jgi:hypothetical protein
MAQVFGHYLEGYDPLSSMFGYGAGEIDYTGRAVGAAPYENKGTNVGNVAGDLISNHPMAKAYGTNDVAMHVGLIALIAVGTIIAVKMMGFRTIIAVGD